MRYKKLIKTLTALALFIALALVYTFAQKGKSNSSVLSDNEEKNSVEAEEIGTPTHEDPWKEMDKLVNAYYGSGNIAYKGSVKLIDDNGDQEKIVEVHPFEYSFFNGNFQYSLDSMEFISQDKYIVAIDHRSRLISLSSAGKLQAGSQLFDMEEFKKIMENQKADALVTQSGNEKMLTIENIQHPQVQGYRVYYDPATYKISKMLIGVLRLSPLNETDENYTEGIDPAPNENDTKETEESKVSTEETETEIDTYTYYIEISYSESRELPSGGKGFDPIQKILKISKDRIELQPAFAAYELLHMAAQTE